MTRNTLLRDAVLGLLSYLVTYSHVIWAVTSSLWPWFPYGIIVSTEYNMLKQCLSNIKLSVNVNDGDDGDAAAADGDGGGGDGGGGDDDEQREMK